MVRVELSRLLLDERSEDQLFCLREVDGQRELPVVTGPFEALAIDRILKEGRPERPLTHDLIGAVVAQLDADVAYALIDDLQGDTYYAKLVLRRGSREVAVDARPSDAVAVALLREVPIYVADRIMRTATSS